MIDVPHRICNLVWEVDKTWYEDDVQEVWEGGRRASWKTTPPGIDGKHRCGTDEDFAEGGTYDDTIPAPRVGALGWPFCCNPPPRLRGGGGAGGIALVRHRRVKKVYGGAGGGGEVVIGHPNTDPAQGGLELGGAAGDVQGATDASQGGLELGGAAGEVRRATDVAQGGLELGGAAGDGQRATDASQGGLELGGAAGDQLGYSDPAQGGLELGGAAGDVQRATDASQGGLELGGAAGDVQRATDASQGGLELGGPAGDRQKFTDAAQGGFQLGGSAGDVPGGPLLVDGFTTNLGLLNGRAVEGGTATPTNWICPSVPWTVISGYATLPSTGFAFGLAWAEAGNANTTSTVTTHQFSSPFASGGLVYRLQDANNYWGAWAFWGSDNPAVTLFKVVAGTLTQKIVKQTVFLNSVIKVVVNGSSHSLYVDGTIVGTITDSAFVTATKYGVIAETTGGTTSLGMTSFKVTAN